MEMGWSLSFEKSGNNPKSVNILRCNPSLSKVGFDQLTAPLPCPPVFHKSEGNVGAAPEVLQLRVAVSAEIVTLAEQSRANSTGCLFHHGPKLRPIRGRSAG